MNFGKYLWGLILILIGVAFLLVNFGAISWSTLEQLWRLWPVLLVALGLSIMSQNCGKIVRGIINLIIVIFILGLFAIFVYPGTREYLTTRSVSSENTNISEPLGADTDSADITLNTGAAKINIGGGSQLLVSGTVESNISRVITERTVRNKTDVLSIKSEEIVPQIFWSHKNTWNLNLNDSLPTKLNLNTGAVDTDLDLHETAVNELSVKSGASTYKLTLGDKVSSFKGEISLGAGSLKIKTPENVGLRIVNDSGASSNNFEKLGLNKNDKTYESKNYQTAEKKIDLTLKTVASSIELTLY